MEPRAVPGVEAVGHHVLGFAAPEDGDHRDDVAQILGQIGEKVPDARDKIGKALSDVVDYGVSAASDKVSRRKNLTNQRAGDILFIDEIHRLRPIIEEFLYPAMEDWQIEIRLSEGPRAQTMTMRIEPFTLIGATTRFGLLTAPMRARFGIVQRLGFYPPEELAEIVRRSARILDLSMTEEGGVEIARRSRGTPRVANRLLRRIRDFAQVRAQGRVDRDVVMQALALLDVDEYGLDEMDARILKTIIEKFDGGPVGVSSLAVALGEDAMTLEEVYEPFLIQEGFLQRTPRGRVATRLASDHLKLSRPKLAAQGVLVE